MVTSTVQSLSRRPTSLFMFVSFLLMSATPIVMADVTDEEMKESKEQVRHYFDHFVVGISDLDRGMNLIEELTGVRPEYGGVLEKLKEQLGLGVKIAIASELKFQLVLGCPKGIVTL